MEKEEIVRKFLEAGLQIDLKTLEYFLNHQNKISSFFSLIAEKSPGSPIITINVVEKMFSSSDEQIRVLKEFSPFKKEITIEQQVELLNQKYNGVSEILLKKIDLMGVISINKIDKNLRKFSIIGMVREKDDEEKTALVEDKTGKLSVSFQKQEEFALLEDDDVIGLVIDNFNDKLSCTKIVWPDIPLRRESTRTSKKLNLSFVATADILEKMGGWLKSNSKEENIIFIASKTDGIEKFSGENPNTTIITYNENIPLTPMGNSRIIGINHNSVVGIGPVNVMVLERKLFEEYLAPGKDVDAKDVIIKFLKKRFLAGKINYIERKFVSDFFLNQIPDMIFVMGSENFSESNYKNATIVSMPDSNNSKFFYFVKLDSRESIKVDLT